MRSRQRSSNALAEYRIDLISGSSNPYNADWPRLHLTPELLAKPVVLLTAPELRKWRDKLFGAMAVGSSIAYPLCATP